MTSGRLSERGYTAMQIYQALLPLGHAPAFDPRKRPDGPLEQDRSMLIGVLLATTELALVVEPPEAAPGRRPRRGRGRERLGRLAPDRLPFPGLAVRLPPGHAAQVDSRRLSAA